MCAKHIYFFVKVIFLGPIQIHTSEEIAVAWFVNDLLQACGLVMFAQKTLTKQQFRQAWLG